MTSVADGAVESSLDRSVVTALYAVHADELRSFLTGVLKNSEAAGEALQATFVRALEVGGRAETETLKGWLFRVAFHEALAHRRRESVRSRHLGELAKQPSVVAPDPADRVVQQEAVERMRRAIDGLPRDLQHIVRLRIYEEKTFAVIAAELGIPLGTALSRMQSALKRLRHACPDDPRAT